jgi:nucleoside-diphosphate-sugar epimerase
MKNISIIGANSFISDELIKLLENQYKILQVYNSNKSLLNKNFDSIKIDDFLNNKPRVDVLFFIATKNIEIQKPTDLDLTFLTNVKLLYNIVSLYPNTKIIYLSSISVNSSIGRVNEFSPTSPGSSYSVSKLWGEIILKYYHKNYVIIRPSSIFGPNMNLKTFLPRIIFDSIKSKTITLTGDGSRTQNYISTSQLARYLFNAINHPTPEVLLACSKKSLTNLELATIISKISGSEINYNNEQDNSIGFDTDNSYSQNQLNINDDNLVEELKNFYKWIKKEF